MEHTQSKKKKKKNRKPIYLLLGFLLFFALFINFITRPSLQSKAIEQIQVCSNVDDVKSIFDRYKFDLLENDENGNKIVSMEFQHAIRNKLHSLRLNEEEISKCIEWLPPTNTNLNVIVIPDLSRRITDSINNSNQIANDIFVLHAVWNQFVDHAKLKQDTRDMLMVDVTDIDQARGQFGNVANQLQFDLSTHKGKTNRLYFTSEKTKQFEHAANEMYASAKQNPLGADYRFYFSRYLINRLKKPTLFENYRNKVIIITDGYLEAENKPADTKIFSEKGSYDYRPILYPAVDIGNVMDIINSKQLNIPKVANLDLSHTDVLVCEVHERKNGIKKDFEILKAYWTDWLQRMQAHKISFIPREQANALTESKIQDFFKY
ncbi:hypothetical protein [Parasegetibacter sp. NRK P23]|uniref:hypothetical protein n=1 Tax=Parasegetibacter sp. NRK P23 TaxID=2942999 RepID=UPI002043B3F4|nr:hypothetical protein [Parasegetibacter sp. NRK P23]MCM5529776.1 hypothetical protein [Parasegetibacter sp. NRK P23]